MSEHTMTIDFSGGWVSLRAKCNAPPEALCRAVWDCECESWESDGVDEIGPWHQASGWDFLDSTFRHYGKPGADPEDCAKACSANDYPDELGSGEITFPIDISWNGDGFTWKVTS